MGFAVGFLTVVLIAIALPAISNARKAKAGNWDLKDKIEGKFILNSNRKAADIQNMFKAIGLGDAEIAAYQNSATAGNLQFKVLDKKKSEVEVTQIKIDGSEQKVTATPLVPFKTVFEGKSIQGTMELGGPGKITVNYSGPGFTCIGVYTFQGSTLGVIHSCKGGKKYVEARQYFQRG